MTTIRVEHRPVRHDLTEKLYKEYKLAMNKLSGSIYLRKAAKFLTGSILIISICISIGILIDRGWVCLSK